MGDGGVVFLRQIIEIRVYARAFGALQLLNQQVGIYFHRVRDGGEAQVFLADADIDIRFRRKISLQHRRCQRQQRGIIPPKAGTNNDVFAE